MYIYIYVYICIYIYNDIKLCVHITRFTSTNWFMPDFRQGQTQSCTEGRNIPDRSDRWRLPAEKSVYNWWKFQPCYREGRVFSWIIPICLKDHYSE